MERLWAVLHRYVTHNRYYRSQKQFAYAILAFMRRSIPQEWTTLRDTISDNFRVIGHENVWILAYKWGKELFARMVQLYSYDFSEMNDWDCDAAFCGCFRGAGLGDHNHVIGFDIGADVFDKCAKSFGRRDDGLPTTLG